MQGPVVPKLFFACGRLPVCTWSWTLLGTAGVSIWWGVHVLAMPPPHGGQASTVSKEAVAAVWGEWWEALNNDAPGVN